MQTGHAPGERGLKACTLPSVAGDGWTDFNVAMAGAGAALAGLIIVAISVNLDPIIAAKTLPSRAAASIATLVLAIAAACLGLMPDQPGWLLGLELVIGAAFVWVIEARSAFLISRDQSRADERLLKIGVGVAPLCVMTVGALMLLLGNTGGSYGIALGSVLAVAGAVLFSWIALIELRR
jgi:hypothetical protein